MAENTFLEQERAVRRLLEAVPGKVLGARVRRERIAQGVSIRDLAESSQLGKSSIVRLEAGEEFRPVTLLKICAALGLHLDRLGEVSEDNAVAVHRLTDDRWYQLGDFSAGTLGGLDRPVSDEERKQFVAEGAKNPLLLLRSRLEQGKLLPTVIEVFEPSETRSHPGEEFVYVLRGSIVITINDKDYELQAGESIDFWGTEMHGYAPATSEPAQILSLRMNP